VTVAPVAGREGWVMEIPEASPATEIAITVGCTAAPGDEMETLNPPEISFCAFET
jgi:hypothetical protein